MQGEESQRQMEAGKRGGLCNDPGIWNLLGAVKGKTVAW
jgi:hypothetical protein